MGDWTPTAEDVQKFVPDLREKVLEDYYDPETARAVGERFDALMAAHDREVAAKALRNAADKVRDYAWQPNDGHALPGVDQGAYMLGANDGHVISERLIRDRADRIERGE